MARPSPVDTIPALPPSRRSGRIFARQLLEGSKPAQDDSTLYLYNVIGRDGDHASDVLRRLSGMSGDITVRVNSPGGDIDQGIAILNGLLRHDGKVTVHVDSLAASIASVIMCAGHEIAIAENAHIMIHEPWALCVGPAGDHAKMAEVLGEFDRTIASIYAQRTGLSRAELSAMMRNETWMDAPTAKRLGFATSIAKNARPSARYDLSIYSNAPAALAAPLGAPSHTYFHSRSDLERALKEKLNLSNAAARTLIDGGFAKLAGFNPLEAIESRLANAIADIKAIRNNV